MRLVGVALALSVYTCPVRPADPPAQKVDQYGDALPPGAVQRLGTARHRVLGETFQFTPDGKSIVAVGWGRNVSLINSETGATTASFTLPIADAHSGLLFPDAKTVLVARQPRHESDNGIWEIWDLARKKLVRQVGPEKTKVGTFGWQPVIAPDGRSIAVEVGGYNTFVLTLIDVDSGQAEELNRDFWTRLDSMTRLGPVFTADGRHVLTGGWTQKSCKLRCWDVRERKSLWEKTLPWPDSPRLRPTPDGRLLLYSDERARTLDLATGEPKELVLAKVVQAECWPDFTSDGKAVFVTTADKRSRLSVWDWKACQPKSPRDGWDIGRWGPLAALSPNGGRALLTNNRPHFSTGVDLRLYDLTNGKPIWEETFTQGHVGAVTYLRFSAGGKRLVSSGDDGTVRAWDVATGRPLGHWPCAMATVINEVTGLNASSGGPERGSGADLTPDGRKLVFAEAATKDHPVRLRVVDLVSGKTVALSDLPSAKAGNGWDIFVGAIVFDPGATSVFVSAGDYNSGQEQGATQSLLQWEIAGDRWLNVGSCEPAPLARSATARGGRTLFTHGKKVQLSTGSKVVELQGAGRGPLALTIDDKLIVGVGLKRSETSDDREPGIEGLRVWDTGTGELAASLPWVPPVPMAKDAPPDELRWAWPKRMALHPSGRILATSDPHGVRLWDVPSGKVYHTYPLPIRPPLSAFGGSPATALAFTPDGTRLATGLPDGTILFWPVPKPEPNPPKADELDALWADVVGPDAAKGWRAAWRLQDDPAA
ncbi:MAG: WD40 repeat domain-containing protein, partial [Zavarzinella sp.]|nr:WD40 repeat domain-containing protein [Zavarzinella sp.]